MIGSHDRQVMDFPISRFKAAKPVRGIPTGFHPRAQGWSRTAGLPWETHTRKRPTRDGLDRFPTPRIGIQPRRG